MGSCCFSDSRGNGLASHFVWTNRAKESRTLDIKHDEAQKILHKLLAEADVLVQNLAPGAAARLGLSYEERSRQYPHLVACDISGYGDDTHSQSWTLLQQESL